MSIYIAIYVSEGTPPLLDINICPKRTATPPSQSIGQVIPFCVFWGDGLGGNRSFPCPLSLILVVCFFKAYSYLNHI